MVEDLSGWECVALKVPLFCEGIDKDLLVANLPLSSQ